jgi:hypothetical protein
MSSTSSVGLVGLSRKNALVLGRTACFHWSRSSPSTSVEATPKRGRNSSITQRHEPNSALAATTWSPARTCPISAVVTAAMPLAVARAASAPSNSAMRRSNMVTVGLE